MGVNIRMMVFNQFGPEGRGDAEQEIVLVNPKVVSFGPAMTTFEEGCLSFPGVGGDVKVGQM